MAFVKKIPISYLFLHKNEIYASAVLIALLAYRTSDTEQRIHGINVLKCAARGTIDFVARSPKMLLGFAQAAGAGGQCYKLWNSIQKFLHPISEWWLHLWLPWRFRSQYSTYPTEEAEQRYWDSAKLFRRQLQSSDARFCLPSSSPRTKILSRDDYEDRIPIITSYQPALPPHRNTRDLGKTRKRWDTGMSSGRSEVAEYHLPVKAFCKWHRMTFPDKNAIDLLESWSHDEEIQCRREARDPSHIALIPNKKALRVRYQPLTTISISKHVGLMAAKPFIRR
ncbi:hypothetical protein BT96DRAFT_717065 [Gymnopus androsaceus JB14]|uniref:Uncharacterized protein n=1 Tax=Gymnopus androsaceus JB14 TaxID=1447944 RepID=A0A6A4HLB0_9AGAR|nr:hypothetical protein BT96DRAFT_717065 [Gymnopus androsaceus JB14]